ncbi:MAG: radical SAM protein [Chloroflexi bacterium]|nr:radical SAM protein [Chloroflexota bacterium]
MWAGRVSTSPLVIHASLFPQAETDAYHFQCDCACPDDGFVLQPRSQLPSVGELPLRHPVLHRQQLADSYTLLFNPIHDRGVAVLNPAAHALWQHFARPQRVTDALAGEADSESLGTIDSLLRFGLLESVGKRFAPRQGAPQTLSTWIHVTNACNLRCDYCYIDKSDEEMPADVGWAAVDAIFRSAAANGFRQVKLKFAGGEALLNWQRVLEMEAYARERSQQTGIGVEAVLLSNGVFTSEEVIAECKTRQIRISISLDGVGDYHDSQRRFVNGRGSFAWVDRTIERLIAAGIHPFISITLSNRNADGLAETVAYALERQLPFNINFFRDNECAAPYGDLRLQDERIINAILRAFAVIEDNLPEQSLLGYLVDRAQFNTPHNRTCSAGQSYLVIDQRGNIAKCQMEIEQPITNVFAPDPLAMLRGAGEGVQNLPVDEKEGCRECEWRYWCAGGCPIATYRATGRYDVKSPNCHIYKAIYPEALRLEGLRLLKLANRYGQIH